MRALRQLWHLFIDDAGLVVGLLLWPALIALALHEGAPPGWAALLLAAGLLASLMVSVLRAAPRMSLLPAMPPMPYVPRRIRRVLKLRWRIFATPSRRIAFIHVPKTAGTALSAAIRDAVLPGRVITGFDRSTFGGFDRFDTIAWRHRRRIYLSAADLPRRAEYLTGHFALSSARAAIPDAEHLMLLREPLCRLLSLWAYWRALPQAELEPWGEWARCILLARTTLAAFLASPAAACQTDNAYVRALLWPHPDIPDDGFIQTAADDRLMHEAAAAMDRIALLEIIEDPALQPNLEAWLGQRVTIPIVNVTETMPAALRTPMARQLTADAEALLGDRSRLDLRLWRLAGERRMPAAQLETLRETVLRKTYARYDTLMG